MMHLLVTVRLAVLMTVVFFSVANADTFTVELSPDDTGVHVVDFEYIADTTATVTLNQLLSGSVQLIDSTTTDTVLSPDIQNYWVSYHIKNISNQQGRWHIGYEQWAYVDIYILDSNGTVQDHIKTGQLHPYYARDTAHHNPGETPFKLTLEAGQTNRIVANLRTSTDFNAYPTSLKAIVLSESDARTQRGIMLKIVYLFAGVLLGTFIYNLFVYLSTRDHSYFYYLGIVACSLLFTFTNFREVPFLDQFDSAPLWITTIDATGGTLYGFFIIMFTRTFLDVQKNFPRLDKLLIGVMIVLLLMPILVLFNKGLIAANVNSLMGLVTMVLVLIAATGSVWKRQQSSGYFLFAFSFFAIGIFIFLSTQLGLLPKNLLTVYAMQYGTSLEAVLFSFALGNRINLLRKENESSQKNLITQMTENEKLQTEWTRTLEEKVEEQTRDLSKTNVELSDQNSALYSVNNLSRELSAQLTRPKIVELVTQRLQDLYPGFSVDVILPEENDRNTLTETVHEHPELTGMLKEIIEEVDSTGDIVRRSTLETAQNDSYSLAVPIRRGDESNGVLILQSASESGFSQASENLIGTLGANIGVALRNASLFEKTVELNEELQAENIRISAELSVAAKLQQMILPRQKELDDITNLQLAASMRPADEVGGDYYDILQSGDRTTIAIGDVTGHGLASGVLMMQTQIALRTLLENTEHDDIKMLGRLNQTVYRNLQRMSEDRNLTLAVVSHEENRVSITGQHEDVLIVKNDGSTTLLDTIDLGFPIGLDPDIGKFLNTVDFTLKSGEGLILYTDGITEAENKHGTQYGIERLCRIVATHWQSPLQQVVDAVIEDVFDHIGAGPLVDDVTLVTIRQP